MGLNVSVRITNEKYFLEKYIDCEKNRLNEIKRSILDAYNDGGYSDVYNIGCGEGYSQDRAFVFKHIDVFYNELVVEFKGTTK
jgi:hypothetical protein